MLPRELGKCFPYSKVPPRVCSRKFGDKGGGRLLGELEETEIRLLQLQGNSSSNNTTGKSDKSTFRIREVQKQRNTEIRQQFLQQ